MAVSRFATVFRILVVAVLVVAVIPIVYVVFGGITVVRATRVLFGTMFVIVIGIHLIRRKPNSDSAYQSETKAETKLTKPDVSKALAAEPGDVAEDETCRKCGFDLRSSSKACPECGEPMQAYVDKPAGFLDRVTLVPRERIALDSGPDFSEAVEAFRDLGFKDVGGYEKSQISGSVLHALGHVEHRLWATVEWSKRLGLFCSVFSHFVSGGGWTATNIDSPTQRFLRPLPGKEMVYLPGAKPDRLLDEWLKVKELFVSKPLMYPEFVPRYEAVVKEMIEARLILGYTPDEIKRINASRGKVLDDHQLRIMTDQANFRSQECLDWVLRERYRLASGLSDQEWRYIAIRVVPIHEAMSVAQALSEFGSLKNLVSPGTGPVLEVFAACNAQLKEDDRFVWLGELTEPIRTDIYLQPEQNSGPVVWVPWEPANFTEI